MLLEVLGHAEALLTLLAEDGLHDLVGGEPLAVLLVLSTEVYSRFILHQILSPEGLSP